MRLRPRPAFTWLAPIAAALICIALLAPWLERSGSEVTVSFATAEGLEAGKTRVRYKDVEIGRLMELRLSHDRSRVLAVVELDKSAERFSTCSTRFWVVRPRVDTAGVSGLTTFISGPYIAVNVGSAAATCRQFAGLETPPSVTSDQNGGRFVLHAASLESLNVGSPVYFRHLQVGQVLNYALARGGSAVDVDIFVKAPYDRYVTSGTRWWHASGIDLRFDSSGLTLDTQAVATLLSGGVAFDVPELRTPQYRAADGTAFALAANRTDAMHRADDAPAASVRMRFNASVRGLSVGAPVDFKGVEIGEVTDIDLDFAPARNRFDMIVAVDLYPHRLGRRYKEALGEGTGAAAKALLQQLVAQGLRGQLRAGSVLTGQRYIALDFFPNVRAVSIDTSRMQVELPTVPNTVEELQDQLTNIVKRLDRVPFDETGFNLDRALVNADCLFQRINTELVTQARTTLAAAERSFNAANVTLRQDSPTHTDIRLAVGELSRALAELTALSDYLEEHPESIVWGKLADE